MTGDDESVDTVLAAIARAAPRPPPTVLAAGTQLGGRYSIVGLLGRGGMGAVYRATDSVLGKDVALKFVDDVANVERLRDEVALAHEVTHRNVCRTYDLERIDDRWVVKMELVEGQSLAERITAGLLAIPEVVAIGRQIAAGLAAAHERGVIHRDLKPHNVMLERSTGRAVLTDFGLARADLQPGGSGAGTPGYMAPEQVNGDGIDRRADVYSFGCVLCAMLAGRVALTTPPNPRARADAPAWLVRHVERLVDPDRDRRPWHANLTPPRKRWAVVVLAIAAAAAIAAVAVLLIGRASVPWRPVLRDVGKGDEYTFQPVFSPDGSRIAYASNRAGPWRIFVESLRDGRSAPIGPRSVSLVNPQWARDGSSIAGETYAQSTASVRWLNLPLLDGVDGTVLAERPPRPCGPRSLVVRGNSAPCGGCTQLLLREVDGREREVVRTAPSEYLRSFSCDRAGLHGVYAIADGPQVPALWFVTFDGGAPRKLGAQGWNPTIHPDGRSVIAAIERDGRQNLWELTLDDSTSSQLTFGEGPDHSPDVSPDGRQVVFVSGEMMWEHSRIYAYRLPGGSARKLAGRRVAFSRMMLAPDGAHLVAEARRETRSEVVLVATDGTGERVLAIGHSPALTPDGRDVVFATGLGPSVIQIMPVAGGPARALATLPEMVRRIEIDEKRVAHIWVRGDSASRIALAGGEPVREAPAPWLFVSPAPIGGWRIAFRGGATL
ncbi:MAG TPA: protein kinase, partial [Kofleriaceae bacterium]